MIKIEDVEVMGIRKAIKGMRNAMNSWDKSDSGFYQCNCHSVRTTWCSECECRIGDCSKCYMSKYEVGDADMDLAKRLIKAGSSDRKFMHMIHVQADVTAPLYWWNEYYTYTVETVPNSCSIMYTIHKKEFTLDDFSKEHIGLTPNCDPMFADSLEYVIMALNEARHCYLDTKDKTFWWQMIHLLPSSFNQMRTIDLDYETLYLIYRKFRKHKFDEWNTFCDWIMTLQYMKEFLGLDEQIEKDKNEAIDM